MFLYCDKCFWCPWCYLCWLCQCANLCFLYMRATDLYVRSRTQLWFSAVREWMWLLPVCRIHLTPVLTAIIAIIVWKWRQTFRQTFRKYHRIPLCPWVIYSFAVALGGLEWHPGGKSTKRWSWGLLCLWGWRVHEHQHNGGACHGLGETKVTKRSGEKWWRWRCTRCQHGHVWRGEAICLWSLIVWYLYILCGIYFM